MMIAPFNKSEGFSMIEVLVSLLVIVIGVLGLAGLQSKTIPYTQDSAQRNTAIMLADDLVDLMRSSAFDSSQSITSYQKPPGSDFPAAASSCVPTPNSISNRLGCWATQAAKVLPGVTANILNKNFYVCWSVVPSDISTTSCGGSGSGKEVEIRLSWSVVNAGDCLDGTTATICTYTIRTRL